ncbi:MAG: glutamine--tRNA ligase/YqeY domain fusion protein [Acidimicrobiales bacterium]
MSSDKNKAISDAPRSDFLRDQIRADLAAGTYQGRVTTRFPPEPNGYLHIGHAKSICLNFGLAEEFGGTCNLRFDDTNPETEDESYVAAIKADVEWLGFNPSGEALFASDYFQQLYDWAERLIENGHAYVDDQDGDTISELRGGFTTPGTNSPFRDRSVEENLDLFRRMKTGEFGDGERVLRAKIDMTHDNMVMRDPVMYRIRNMAHYRTGDKWHIYPNYDWAHGQEDAIEGITHSVCTLEFDNNRELYDWYHQHIDLPVEKPNQYEFARLNLTHIVTSKRKLLELVENGTVDGWDDAVMPTLSGLRRRGYPAAAIRAFCDHIGVAKTNSTVEIEMLESFVRTELNRTALRRSAVLNPLKVIIENYPEGQTELRQAVNNPEDETAGTRDVPFGRELYIEHDDFAEDPPPKFYRLTVGREVRLRYGYFITCTGVVKDDEGNIVELRASYDPDTDGGKAPDGRKVKSTIHWVSAEHAVDATVLFYDRLFTNPHPGSDGADPLASLNPAAKEVIEGAKLEPALVDTPAGEVVQFERLGYFAHDQDQPLLFHRTVGLRDEWARIQKRNG